MTRIMQLVYFLQAGIWLVLFIREWVEAEFFAFYLGFMMVPVIFAIIVIAGLIAVKCRSKVGAIVVSKFSRKSEF